MTGSPFPPRKPRESVTTIVGRGASLAAAASLGLLFILPLVALLTFSPVSALISAGSDRGFRDAVEFTLISSGLAVAVALLLGVPVGYLLARRRFRGKSLVEAFVNLPLLIPHLIVGIALVILFDRAGVQWVGTLLAVVLAMAYVSTSYAVTASQIAFRSVDPSLLEAARSLGATAASAFRTITLPIASRGIITGGVLAWARSVSEVGALLIVAYSVSSIGPSAASVTSPASVYIYNLYSIFGVQGAVPAAALFILLGFAIFVAVRLLERLGYVAWRRAEFQP